ncbi:hypothetical protein [Robbsia andropogonis]|uniref:hypothetical protein n=1 Tax=Robbsia andropogonis TaxID=28092 RepID=UPI0020A0670B|nr:hypothetical protein [Robbsia andropogonis]MCP1119763.1 hypothetical protein [Robbsia andropogonis]MCP1129746.1 hypothetical protein [Robbsia andropogonis]
MSLLNRIERVRRAFEAGLVPTQSDFKDLIDLASAPYVKGMIMMFSGSADDIPNGWNICDGEEGRPDLVGRFVLGVGAPERKEETEKSKEQISDDCRIPFLPGVINAATKFRTGGEKLEFKHMPSHAHRDTVRWGDVTYVELKDDGTLKMKANRQDINTIVPRDKLEPHWTNWFPTGSKYPVAQTGDYWLTGDIATFSPISLVPYGYSGYNNGREHISTRYNIVETTKAHTRDINGNIVKTNEADAVEEHAHNFDGNIQLDLSKSGAKIDVPYFALCFIIRTAE